MQKLNIEFYENSKTNSKTQCNNQEESLQIESQDQNKCMKNLNKSNIEFNGPSIEEKLKLKSLYIKNRSKWTNISSEFVKDWPSSFFCNHNYTKNFFHNALRKLASRLSNIQRQNKTFQKSSILNKMLQKLVDLSIMIQQHQSKIGFAVSKDSNILHQVRQQILDCCFSQAEFQQKQLFNLAKMVRNLNYRYKNMKFNPNSFYNEDKIVHSANSILKKLTSSSFEFKSRRKNSKMQQLRSETESPCSSMEQSASQFKQSQQICVDIDLKNQKKIKNKSLMDVFYQIIQSTDNEQQLIF